MRDNHHTEVYVHNSDQQSRESKIKAPQEEILVGETADLNKGEWEAKDYIK